MLIGSATAFFIEGSDIGSGLFVYDRKLNGNYAELIGEFAEDIGLPRLNIDPVLKRGIGLTLFLGLVFKVLVRYRSIYFFL